MRAVLVDYADASPHVRACYDIPVDERFTGPPSSRAG